MADEQRIAVLEQHVRKLYEQIGALRKELGRAADVARRRHSEAPLRAAQRSRSDGPPLTRAPEPRRLPPPPPSPSRDPILPAACPDIDLEKLFGRYGTIAVASLAILMASEPSCPGRSSTDCSARPFASCSDSSALRSSQGSACGFERSAMCDSATCSSRSRSRSCTSMRGPRARISRCSARSPRSRSPPRIRGTSGARTHLRGANALRDRIRRRDLAPFVTAQRARQRRDAADVRLDRHRARSRDSRARLAAGALAHRSCRGESMSSPALGMPSAAQAGSPRMLR